MTKQFGAHLCHDGTAIFNIWAPSAATVGLLIGEEEIAMRPEPGGWFTARIQAAAGSAYQFVFEGGLIVPDPASRAQLADVHGPSLIVDDAAYVWQHPAWRNRPWHEAVIYEMHAGLAGGFQAIRARLKYLASLGITAIELMPVADFPGARNWGYDGVLPFAPDRAYGTPGDLRALVDAAHGEGLMVLLDVVYNHFGPDGAYLHAYAPEFFDAGSHTPWGAAIDFERPEVGDFFIQNALMWLSLYRFDGLRFDAAHAIMPQSFLQRMAAEIRAGAERPVHLVLEHEGNRASLLHGPEKKLYDAQWSDDWHHCLHVLLTGEQEGYYENFHDPAVQLARAMAEGFVYQGEISPHHQAKRGEPSAALPPSAFVICLQNHDQIGNRALGERLSQLADPRALAAATALLLLSPNIPLLFMGEEWGGTAPFLFFTDHTEELADAVREGRRREFRHFAAFADAQARARIPDPNALSSFTASIPDVAQAQSPPHDAILALHRRLLALRRTRIMPGLAGCRSIDARALGPRAVQASWRLGNGAILDLAANFGAEPVACDRLTGEVLFASTQLEAPDRVPPYSTRASLVQPCLVQPSLVQP